MPALSLLCDLSHPFFCLFCRVPDLGLKVATSCVWWGCLQQHSVAFPPPPPTYYAKLCCTVRYTMLSYTMLCHAVLYHALLYHAVLCCAVLCRYIRPTPVALSFQRLLVDRLLFSLPWGWDQVQWNEVGR